MRRQRKAKIVATPRSGQHGDRGDPAVVRCRRRCVPAQLQPRQPRGPPAPLRRGARGGARARPAHRGAGRPAGRSCASAPSPRARSPCRRAMPSCSTAIPPQAMPRACTCRIRNCSARPTRRALLIDDGKVQLRIESVAPGSLATRVVNSGTLSDRKGVNVPDAVIPIPAPHGQGPQGPEFALSLGSTGSRCPSCSVRPTSSRRVSWWARAPACWPRSRSRPRCSSSRRSCACPTPSWWRAATSAWNCRPSACWRAAHPALVPAAWQTHRDRHADAGVDDRVAGAHARRGSDVASAIYDGADAVMLSADRPMAATRCRRWR